MPKIDAGDVRPGKCFIARADGRVRRVQSVRSGDVIYEVRSHKVARMSWSKAAEVSVSEFVSEVDREVSCDYDRSSA